MSSREQQRFQFERSLSSSIETTLSALDGVLDVRVHLNLPVSDPLFGKPVNSQDKGSASVLLITGSVFPNSNEQIASLVAGASGISSKNVSVLISVKNKEKAENVFTVPSERIFEENFLENQSEEIAFTPINGEHLMFNNQADPILEVDTDFYKNKLWIFALGALCFLGLSITLFSKPKISAKKPEQVTKATFKGIKPHDFTNAIRSTEGH